MRAAHFATPAFFAACTITPDPMTISAGFALAGGAVVCAETEAI